MEDLFEDLVGFLMHDQEVVQTENAEEILAGEGNDDHMMPTGTFTNGTDDHELEEADWYTQYSDLHIHDHHPNQFGEELMMYGNHPSNDVRSDNLLLDVNDFFQVNGGLIDQYLHEETWPLQQQQAADNDCHYHHQPQSSTLLIPAVIPQIDDNLLSTDIVNFDQLLNNHPHSSTPKQQVKDRQECRSKLPKQLGEPSAKRPKRRKKDKQVLLVNHGKEEDDALGAAEADAFVKDVLIDISNDDDDADDEENIGDDNQSSVVSKNLVSERNRRKRLNQQLFTLRAIVPSITKMDKRSVLVDALAYLQDILNQTQIEIEAKNNISSAAAGTENLGHAITDSRMPPDSSTVNAETKHPPCHHLGVVNASVEGPAQAQQITTLTVLEPSTTPYSAIFPAITKMEAAKVDEERYLLKIVYNKALGAMSQVQRSVEMLKGFDFISVSVSEYDQHHMQSSNFLRVKKIKGSLLVTDEENLLERVKVMAKQLGIHLPRDASSADD